MGLDRRETGWFYPPTTWYERRIPQKKHRAEIRYSAADDRQFCPTGGKNPAENRQLEIRDRVFFMQQSLALVGKLLCQTRAPPPEKNGGG